MIYSVKNDVYELPDELHDEKYRKIISKMCGGRAQHPVSFPEIKFDISGQKLCKYLFQSFLALSDFA